MKNPYFRLFLSLVLFFPVLSAYSQVVEGDHVDAELVSEISGVIPGQSFWVALRLDHDEHWHTYWKNPGDAGKPTEISWNLPAGVSAGEIVWPLPQRLELPADLVDFGYENEVFLLTEITLSEEFSSTNLSVSADVQWLECDEICIPGGALVNLSLPLENSQADIQINQDWVAGFTATRAAQPVDTIELDSMYTIMDGKLNLLLQATDPIFGNVSDVTFIPGEHRVFDYISEQEVTHQLSSLQLTQGHHRRLVENPPQQVTGLLLVSDEDGSQTVYGVNARPEGVDFSALGLGSADATTEPPGLSVVFLLALAGGFVLNLMPCVFPVLSLKVLSLAQSSNSSRTEQKLHALVYTAGVILAFLALAGVLLILQASGAAVGWGFHLQSPWFVSLLILLFFTMALSLSGVIEVGTGLMGIGSNLSQHSGYRGSFFTGVLATVVASPCTAPFMSIALGVAFTQTAVIALTIFAALGLGMALPFLLIAFIPALAAAMPKPGKWMLWFKHLMAVPLFLTVLWMSWFLSRQVGLTGTLAVVLLAVVLGLVMWARHRSKTDKQESALWRQGSLVGLGGLALVLVFILQSPLLESRPLVLEGDGSFEVFSNARLAELRSEGTPVFVNMTASWCITCLVNERVTLGSDSVKEALSENGVVYMKGDWTNNDPEITAVLKQYETSGVPLYLMFPADSLASAERLPQILSEGDILDALSRI